MRSWIVFFVLALGACAADTSGPRGPGQLEVVMGADQVGAPARSLDTLVVVRLTDDRGDPIEGAAITWAVTGGEGRIEQQGTTTGPDGLVTALWILGSVAGAQQLQVSASGVGSITVDAEARGFRALAVAVSTSAVCAVDTTSTTRCWGNLDEYDFNHDLDYGDTPVVVDSTRHFTAIAGGASHFCALTAMGEAWCWGYPHGGQLGTDAGAVGSIYPQLVAGGHSFVSISANWRTTCALDVAGQAWCWGSPGDGSLGTGAPTELAPAAVQQGSTLFTSISPGYEHICALDSNAEAWCWGHQDVGQLGDSLGTSAEFPSKVTGGRQYGAITAGDHFTCANELDLSVWCWGSAPLSPYQENIAPTSIGVNGVSQLAGDDGFLVGLKAGRPVAAGQTGYNGVPEELGSGTLTEIPGGILAVDRIAFRSATICMIRSDDQLFCAGQVPGYGSSATPIGIPAP